MRSALLIATVMVSTACGSPVMGTWRYSGAQNAIDDIVIDGQGWQVGGGCTAPLSFTSSVGELTTANWTCPLNSATGLPFNDLVGYQWKSGDVLVVKNARFQLLTPQDVLSLYFSVQYRTNPADSTVGPNEEFTSNAGDGWSRVK